MKQPVRRAGLAPAAPPERVVYGLAIKPTSTPTPQHAESLAQWMRLAGPSSLA